MDEMDIELFKAVEMDYSKIDNRRELYEDDLRKWSLSESVITTLIRWYQSKYDKRIENETRRGHTEKDS